MPKRLSALAAVLQLALSAPAQATIWCTGTVASVFTRDSGEVVAMLSYRGADLSLCAVSGTWNGISAATCNAWLATLQSALMTGRLVELAYETTATCATLPTYTAAPPPLFVRLL